MNAQKIITLGCTFTRTSPDNTISAEKALRPDIIGMQLFDEPIFGFASADDDYFASLETSHSGAVARPHDWLDGAKTIISFFMPFSKRVNQSNIADTDPSPEWRHARIDGQRFIGLLAAHLKEALEQAGYPTVVPILDPRFQADTNTFVCNWSERHVAYACGLGTFSLSKNLITEKGVAGRFGSLITTLELPPTTRPYTGLEDYCTHCGACVSRCPAGAINAENGTVQTLCRDQNYTIKQKYKPYAGCGKCQVAVPCSLHIPKNI